MVLGLGKIIESVKPKRRVGKITNDSRGSPQSYIFEENNGTNYLVVYRGKSGECSMKKGDEVWMNLPSYSERSIEFNKEDYGVIKKIEDTDLWSKE
ncbi:hypothetical protein ACFLZZ_02865 [Nanoarchaeota archaeon]